MKTKYFYLTILLIYFSCSREQEINDENITNIPPVNTNNNAPEDFAVKIDSITSESAYLSWEKAIDPDGNEVIYDVTLQGTTLLSNSDKLEFKINNLNELTHYTGEVIAKDEMGNNTKVNFEFSTEKYYLKFLKKYSFPQTNYGGMANQLIKLRDDNYLILGMTQYLGVGKKLAIIKTDKFGNEVWNKMLPIDYEGHIAGFNMKMIQCNNSDNIIIGAGANVSKIDFNGNVMWVKNLPNYNVPWAGSGIESLIEDANNDIYVVGHAKSTNNQKHSAGQLTKLNSNGVVIFNKTYEGSFTTEFHDIILDNQKLIIFGTKEISGITWNQYLQNFPLKVRYNIVFTDYNGNIINEKNYNYDGYSFAQGIFKKNNGNYIFYGYTTGMDYYTNIYEINQVGDIIWKKDYNFGQISSVKETPQGNLMAIGMYSGYAYTRTFIYLNDNLGNSLWFKDIYEIGASHFGRDVLPDDDGGYRFLISRDIGFVELYKTDPNGNL